jgi:DNA (cytosine-5)-methyltransferase 1
MGNGLTKRKVTFGDVFAGCGGLSLGFLQAGLEGRFAIESDRFAFATLQANLLSANSTFKFKWPLWLPKKPITIGSFLRKYQSQLQSLNGKIDVLGGGPPCQGFSYAGRRKYDDPRNQLFRGYLRLVKILSPRVLVIENVRGFTADFETKSSVVNYADKLRHALSAEYDVFERLLDLSQFGVPQSRTRYFLVALEPNICSEDPFDILQGQLPSYLRSLRLTVPVASKAAISDLEIERGGKQISSENTRFHEIIPVTPLTRYQKLMNDDSEIITDLRLARHSEEITDRFRQIIELSHAEGRLNTTISAEVRARFGLRKMALRVLDPDRPAPTITSLPDDLIHYNEARTLTVRETARLQTFPDWFSFQGKYTTGGHLRRIEVPRFTQVANAVPPLVARAIGEMIVDLLNGSNRSY